MPDSVLKNCSISSAVAMALALPLDAPAVVDMFLNIPGVEGESNDNKHKGEIDVLRWSWGMSESPAEPSSRGPCVEDLKVTKFHDSATPFVTVFDSDDETVLFPSHCVHCHGVPARGADRARDRDLLLRRE